MKTRKELNNELDQLKQELTLLQRKLFNIAPHQVIIRNLKQELTDQAQHYQIRVDRAEEKWESSEKKLELVRDLLVTNKLTKLQTLFAQGKI